MVVPYIFSRLSIVWSLPSLSIPTNENLPFCPLLWSEYTTPIFSIPFSLISGIKSAKVSVCVTLTFASSSCLFVSFSKVGVWSVSISEYDSISSVPISLETSSSLFSLCFSSSSSLVKTTSSFSNSSGSSNSASSNVKLLKYSSFISFKDSIKFSSNWISPSSFTVATKLLSSSYISYIIFCLCSASSLALSFSALLSIALLLSFNLTIYASVIASPEPFISKSL